MPPRDRTAHVCQQCDYRTAKWLGRCPDCGAWASLVEQVVAERRPLGSSGVDAAEVIPYPDVPASDRSRSSTGVEELDRVLGGGLTAGAVVLVGGEPGIGKSTLLLQAASAVADAGRDVLYVSGEESAAQLRLRGDRLGVRSPRIGILASTDVDAICAAARASRPALLVVDSIQAVRCPELASVPGSVGQVREAAARFVGLAKATGIPVMLVGHVTKEGSLAGPRALEHIVDTVVHFEGDRHHAHRILRTLKNRFGATDEIGVFTMTERGLAAVASPSEIFLAERSPGAPGSAVLGALEGSRPLLVEIQALIGEPTPATPRRASLGVDPNRVAMILAVLNRTAGVELSSRDVFVNVTGGLRVDEPGADLSVAAAVLSSERREAVRDGLIVVGEIGLTGEIRSVPRLGTRLKEASRLGFRGAVVPGGAGVDLAVDGLELYPARNIEQAVELLFGGR
jgi:DNA repair protein RadA/Sms